jgi:hypothetical protein
MHASVACRLRKLTLFFSDARAKLLEGQLEQQRRALQKKEEVNFFNISL